jgi:hypothetical protein
MERPYAMGNRSLHIYIYIERERERDLFARVRNPLLEQLVQAMNSLLEQKVLTGVEVNFTIPSYDSCLKGEGMEIFLNL